MPICNDCDDLVDTAACIWCVVGVGLAATGCPAGLLELAACVSCLVSVQQYQECSQGGDVPFTTTWE